MIRKLVDKIMARLGYYPHERYMSCVKLYVDANKSARACRRDYVRYKKRWQTACQSARRERKWRRDLQRINGELAVEVFALQQRMGEVEPESAPHDLAR